MGNRLDKDREAEIEPKRFDFAVCELSKLGYGIVLFPPKRIEFKHKGEKVTFYPYSGWHTGKSIVDGRGINKLMKQLQKAKVAKR